MFYSHQLIARKAPFGQIWMAATLLAKNNGKTLNKLNIIRICEEILNPSVPMALRLSGILMDVTCLLVEMNEAWKLKAVAAGPTMLPIGKTQAKYEAVILKDNGDTDVGDIEQSLHFSTTTAFRAASFFPEMYYSQLLARKGPLGRIWMAATLHVKINRKRHNKLNIIQIGEEIWNPSVPKALWLSGILMGGVVTVYKRKWNLLYDDVSRLLVERNEAWKLKTVAADPTNLPIGKTQAKIVSEQ